MKEQEKEQMIEMMGTFNHYKYDEKTWFLSAMGGTLHIYLLEGEDFALLIDTGFGIGNLKDVVSRLTDKEVLVANTHGHVDHIGGNGYWEKAFMHKNAILDMPVPGTAMSDINLQPHPDYEKIFLEEGDILDLGNRKIEVFDISAHSNGSLAFLDSSHRLIYVGDEIESSQVLLYPLSGDNVLEYDFYKRCLAHKNNMAKLLERSTEYDFIAPGHNGTPISKEYIREFYELDELLLCKKAKYTNNLDNKFFEMRPEAKDYRRAVHKNASFFIDVKYL